MLTDEAIEDYRTAGRIIAKAIEYGETLIKPGANILEVCEKIEQKIIDSGAEIAFPAQPSIDSIAAHWCPEPDSEETFQEGQLVKLDIGCHINGRIADRAISIDLTADGKHAALIKAVEDARDAALFLMTPGRTLGEIGRAVQDTITAAGFSPIRNLSGHGLDDYDVHTWPSIPNVDTGDQTQLEEGMVIAVEPFATTGSGQVYERDEANIYSFSKRRPVRGQYARTALKIIEEYNGLPFTLHWLAKRMGTGQAKFAMRELVQAEVVETHPPLPEQSGAVVAQAEHSAIITSGEPIVYTRP
jgi:methionyl aminopeptidase